MNDIFDRKPSGKICAEEKSGAAFPGNQRAIEDNFTLRDWGAASVALKIAQIKAAIRGHTSTAIAFFLTATQAKQRKAVLGMG